MKYDLKEVSLVIATYNEEESIGATLFELKDYKFYEIVIVDNNSNDKTVEIAKQFNVKIINQNNKGWGNAVIQAFNDAGGKYITYIDGDGSYNPKAIVEMFSLVDEYDFILSSRYKYKNYSEDDTMIRFIGNKIFTFITSYFLSLKTTDALFFYPLIKKDDFEKINPKSTSFGLCIEIPYLLSLLDLKYTEILSFERKRYAGESKVNAFSDGLKILFELVKLKLKN